jgi:hypothetical protein
MKKSYQEIEKQEIQQFYSDYLIISLDEGKSLDSVYTKVKDENRKMNFDRKETFQINKVDKIIAIDPENLLRDRYLQRQVIAELLPEIQKKTGGHDSIPLVNVKENADKVDCLKYYPTSNGRYDRSGDGISHHFIGVTKFEGTSYSVYGTPPSNTDRPECVVTPTEGIVNKLKADGYRFDNEKAVNSTKSANKPK